MKLLLLVPAIALLTLGVEGLYHATRGREKVAVDCAELARARPRSHRLLVTGCQIDYAGAGYRASGGRIEEVFVPASAQGHTAAPIVLASRDASAVSVAQALLGYGQAATPEQSLAIMRKVVGVLGVENVIDGLARAGSIERLRSRRILSGLSAPVSPDAIIVDVRGTPEFTRPLLALGAGAVLGLLPFGFLWRPRSRPLSEQTRDTRDKDAHATRDRLGPAGTSISLPRLLLLKLDGLAGPEAIESAPPLGTREKVAGLLRGAVPDLDTDHSGAILARPGDSLRFDLGTHDPVPTVVVDAHGEAGVALVKEVLLMTGWRAFAPKTGLFISVDELTAIEALASERSDLLQPET
jgi:hypothetical protein